MFKVKITLDIENADGTPFFSNVTEYASMPYPAVVLIERKLVNVLVDLVAEGEKRALLASN